MTDEGLWVYRARPTRVIDGDTLYVEIDHGMCIRSVQSLRVAGYDAPEMFTGTPEERLDGAAGKRWVQDWLGEYAGGAWPLRVTTIKDSRSFNRYVALIGTVNGRDLTTDWTEAHP